MRPQEVPHLHLRIGEVDVTAPDPLSGALAQPLFEERRDRRGLRVVDDHVVVGFVEEVGVQVVVVEPDLPHLGSPVVVHPLQAVVHRLRDVEELIAALHHLPVGGETNIVHERHQRAENLGDAAAEGGCIDVENAGASEAVRQPEDFFCSFLADDRAVRLERLWGRRDRTEH